MLTEEQREQRKGKVTSSVAAGCLGLCPFTSPLQAWREILGLRAWEGSKATERGDVLEDTVIEWGAGQVGDFHTRAPFVDGGWRGDSSDGILYAQLAKRDPWPNPRDPKTNPNATIEAKTVGMGMASLWGTDGTNQVPDHVRVQCMWHLLHWPTAKLCYVPVLFGGHAFEFRMYTVERDDDQIARLESLLHKWWQDHIETLCAPDANHLDEGELRSMFPKDDSTMLADDDQVAEHAIGYMIARDKMKVAKQEKDHHGNRLRQLLDVHSGCCGPWGSVQCRADRNGTRVLRVKEVG